MYTEISALCDAATDQGGKLNLLGTFDRLLSGDFPLVVPQCAVAFRFRYSHSEAGDHGLKLYLEDSAGRQVLPPLDAKVPFPPVQGGRESQAVNLVLNMQRLRITAPGLHTLRLTVDGNELVRLPLWVEDATPREPNPLQGN